MNHYETLEVSPKASPEVIKAAYKSLMQRYHPDRNPGDARHAERSILIGKAYEVLSDPERRAAYDLELQQRTGRSADSPAMRPSPRPSVARRQVADEDDGQTSFFDRWLIFAVAVVAGSVSFWLFFKQAPLETVQQAAHSPFTARHSGLETTPAPAKEYDEAFKGNPAPAIAETSDDFAARTIAAYVQDMKVTLKPSNTPNDPSNDSAHTLSIPTLSLTVGTFDSDKFRQYIKDNQDVISRKLVEALTNAKYDDLNKSGGTAYLKKFILDSIGEIVGADRFAEYPSPSGGAPLHYGVVDVALPDSFSVR